ncbi:MAG: TRAP transporter small permease subunit, partial [Rhodospirillales bacterium]|nr:TRAP transporter small permease subunit [Rhodospirillales bacterium]
MTERLVGAPIGVNFSKSVDHLSRFLGLSVGNLYIIAAACTLWEVTARYVFNSPTQWVFEVVMVLCATAWMMSAGYVTLQKRHIGITVLYLMASDRVRWWLDLFAMVVGVFALYMLTSDTLIRALESIDLVERGGTAWNSPLPLLLKTVLVAGLFVYLVQLLVNLRRHFHAHFLQVLIYAVLALICARLLLQIFGHYGGDGSALYGADQALAEGASTFWDSFRVDRDEVGIATISMVIV